MKLKYDNTCSCLIKYDGHYGCHVAGDCKKPNCIYNVDQDEQTKFKEFLKLCNEFVR